MKYIKYFEDFNTEQFENGDRIIVHTEFENKIIQEYLFRNGYEWCGGQKYVEMKCNPFYIVLYSDRKDLKYSNFDYAPGYAYANKCRIFDINQLGLNAEFHDDIEINL